MNGTLNCVCLKNCDVGFQYATYVAAPGCGILGQIKKSFKSICVLAGQRSAKNVIMGSCFPIKWEYNIERRVTAAVGQSPFKGQG